MKELHKYQGSHLKKGSMDCSGLPVRVRTERGFHNLMTNGSLSRTIIPSRITISDFSKASSTALKSV